MKIWNASARIITAIVITNLLIVALVGLLIGIGRFDDLQTDFIFMHVMFTVLGIINTLLIFIWFLDYMGVVIAQYQFEQIFTRVFYKLLGIACVGWFFAALKEEVLARGYFMANLNRLTIPKAIFISSLLFMALHFVMGDLDPYKAASWFKGGLVYAYIYVKSRSLTVSTMVHAAHNLVNNLFIHGSQGALVLLNTTVTTADKLIYELVQGTLLLLLTYLFYGKNGVFTPSRNLELLWNKKKLTDGGQ
jgi:membrane protease YdiL (CAAX protease family)